MTKDAVEYDGIVESPIGRLGIRVSHGSLTGIDFLGQRSQIKNPASKIGRQVTTALTRYFRAPSVKPDLSLDLQGTDFQRRVWLQLLSLPAGKTITYGELARRLQSGPRAVGNACRANPIPIFVPCHRVVSVGGIGGYAGAVSGVQLGVKRWLLAHEGKNI